MGAGRPSTGKTTIYDIARETGLSPSTVSRALTRPGRVSVRTEMLVRTTAERLGYRSQTGIDSTASTSSVRSELVAIVSPDNINPLYARCIRSAQIRLERAGYRAVILDSHGSTDAERDLIHRFSGKADGFMLVSPRLNEPELRRAAAATPTIMLHRRISGLPSVVSDVYPAVVAAIRTLHDTGHRGVTYLSGPESSWSSEYRRRCIWQAAGQFDMTYRVVRQCAGTIDGGHDAYARFGEQPTDAVIAYNDQLAVGFVREATADGTRVPDDVSVIGFDDTLVGRMITPSLSSIGQSDEQVGDMAAQELLTAIRRGSTGGETLFSVPAVFLQRDSIARKRLSVPPRTFRTDTLTTLRNSEVELTLLTGIAEEMAPALDAFMERYPKFRIRPLETGTQAESVGRLWNRLQARHNVPDLFRMEYDKMPEFAINGTILNFRNPRLEREFESRFAPRPWRACHFAGGLFGVPADITPVAMFRRLDVLERFGLPVPATWEEYHDIGVELHRADPSRYMGFINTSDAQHYLSFFRMAGLQPWRDTDSIEIDVDLTTDAMLETSGFLQRCIDDGVLSAESTTVPGFRERLRDGRFVAPIQADWFGNVIIAADPEGSGRWGVSLPPAVRPGEFHSAEVGGSILTINSRIPREKQAAAIAFAYWLIANPTAVDMNPLPVYYSSTTYFADKPDLDTRIDPYFGQNIYGVFRESAAHLDVPWRPLPFMSQVDADFRDTMIPSLTPGGDSVHQMAEWQQGIIGYAQSHGFRMK
ncbi:extracellular solute-binding protein [Bifidobacterium sp. MA2]|uniref:Extracellular solute-binding protein n=1 Tax=Bifidobacterium santillanense TaxID=2809028 RepID=A0ABS5UMJ4_9BIFI|nr:substrate-binding domain-containing protein [Bifidobacterium santillanense]MBT1172136.1 extracellular solute-binding protein [Bifidobacterium santillanense]